MKLHIWRIYAFLVSWVTLNQKCLSQTSFLTVYDDRCITNASSAVAIIYDLSDPTINNLENDKVDGLKIRHLIENDGDGLKGLCGETSECFRKSDNWFLVNSLSLSSVNNLIKDRRWEEFPTIITNEKRHTKIYEINGASKDISIPFSIQTNGDAFVLICDGADFNQANCYWFMLQDQILRFNLCIPGPKCATPTDHNLKHKINEDGWNHFKISKIGDNIYFEGQDDRVDQQIRKFNIQPRFLFFITKKTGFWKLHNFNYYMMKESANNNLETKYPLNMSKGRHCLAMFVMMCETCWIEIKAVSNKATSDEKVPSKTVKTQQWKEIKFIFDMDEPETIRLQIVPQWQPSEDLNTFWALGSLRSCGEAEVRTLQPAYPEIWTQKCQLIKRGYILKINKHRKVSVLENCTENQFGENCLPCEKYFNDKQCPKERKYCQLLNEKSGWEEKCYCSIGYQGESCSEPCVNRTYGHGCQNSCTNCKDGCDNDTIFGECNSARCADNYMGKKCDKFMPRVRNFDYYKTTSEFLLTWLAPVGVNDDQLLNYILFFEVKRQACKEITNTGNFNISIPALKNKNEYEVRHDLKPYSEYYIKIRVNTSAGLGAPMYLNLTTDAAEQIQQEEFPNLHFVTLSSDNAMVNFIEGPCEIRTGPIYVDATVTSEINPWCRDTKNFNAQKLKNGNLDIKELKPFCTYNATFRFYRKEENIEKEISTSFETLENAPNEITQLKVISKGSTHISFRWLPPYPPTGQLVEYKLSYCSTRYSSGCSNTWFTDTFEPSPCKVWPQYHCHKLTVTRRKANIYFIKVQAKNIGSKLYSNPVENGPIWADEKKSDPPYGLTIVWTEEYNLDVSWYHPNATNGLLFSFKYYVNEIEHKYKIESEEDYLLVYKITIKTHLTIPDDYTLKVVAVNIAGESDEAIISEASPPPVPVHQEHIRKIAEQNTSIAITFNNLKVYKKKFEQFLYVLITECSKCEKWVDRYKYVLVKHHETYDSIKPIESINWTAIISFSNFELGKTSNRTLYIGKDVTNDVKYNIKPNTIYRLAFIWIYKLERYVRMNCTTKTIEICCQKALESDSPSGLLAFIICLLLLILVLMGVYLRWKKGINEKAQELMDRIRSINAEVPTAAVQYENHKLNDQVTLIPQKNNMNSATIRNMPESICPGNPLFKTKNSLRVKLASFRNYVKDVCESNELRRQHNLFPHGPTRSWTYGALPQNKAKNRYINLIAYNHSRVVLNKLGGDDYSDYINASYIDGYHIPRAYIATQGPKTSTIPDFWRMVWQEKVTYIVMMANVFEGGKKKVEQYWPNTNEKLIFGDFTITFVSSEIHAHYDYRKFLLHYRHAKARQICHLHFKAWPDHGVPLYPQSLVPILEKMLTFRTADFPIVVHCSAGVGRTGTVILCDLCLRMAASEGCVDVLAMLEHLRNQRANMVDNVEQYKLAHLIILNCLLGLRTSISINKNFTKKMEKYFQDGVLTSQMEYIRDCEWEDEAMKVVTFVDDDEEMSVIPEKNRFSLIIPDNTARVFLHPYPDSDPSPSSTYINAVRVDAFCEPGRFIVTQYPLPNTVGDFWRLVAEKGISVIVCLNDLPVMDESCGLFFPVKLDEISPEETIKIGHIMTRNFQVYTVLTFQMTKYDSGREVNTTTIEIVKFRGWKTSQTVPDDFLDFATFVEDATLIARKSAPTLITCYDGATACGLFIAMSFVLEKIKLEHACDVCQAVRSMRTSRKQFIKTEEQLKFLYTASLLYVEEKFNNYANVNI